GAEATLTNFRMALRGTRQPPDIVTIVAIDDDAVRQTGTYPLPREVLAKIVASIAALKPKAIALDLLLVDRGPESADVALVDALKQGGSIMAAAAVFPDPLQTVAHDDSGPLAGLPSAQDLLLPQQRFTDVAAIGVVNVETDKTGTPRFAPMLFRSGQRIEP